MSIRYFFVKDQVYEGEVSIKYCPTHIMLADYFTKPLQGRTFRVICEVIIRLKPLLSLAKELPSSKEHVGENVDASN